MAIKFENKKDDDREAAETRATIKARFATPIETDEPVNPDAVSELPFGKMPRTEKKAKKRR